MPHGPLGVFVPDDDGQLDHCAERAVDTLIPGVRTEQEYTECVMLLATCARQPEGFCAYSFAFTESLRSSFMDCIRTMTACERTDQCGAILDGS